MQSKKASDHWRLGAGILLFNREGKVWIGKRSLAAMPLGVDASWRWQLPQGGIDKGETPEQAAWRELREETGQNDAVLLQRSRDWLSYRFPEALIKRRFLGGAVGQKQQWFAMGFLGGDEKFNLNAFSPPEFEQWRWEAITALPDLVVPFKRDLYHALLREFASLAEIINTEKQFPLKQNAPALPA